MDSTVCWNCNHGGFRPRGRRESASSGSPGGNLEAGFVKVDLQVRADAQSATVVIDAAGKGIKVAVDAVTADGPMKWGYTTMRDGKDGPVTGHPYYQAAASTQTSPTEGTIVYKNGGKAVVTVKTSVSKDGKTLTVTTTGTDAKGQALNSVAVYTKRSGTIGNRPSGDTQPGQSRLSVPESSEPRCGGGGIDPDDLHALLA